MLRGNRPNRKAAPMTGRLHPISLPTRGVNYRTAYDAMDPRDAIAMTNIISDSKGLSTRMGYRVWASGLPSAGAVGTLMSYYPTTAKITGAAVQQTITKVSGQLFAATNNQIYDITTSGTGPWTPQLPEEAPSNFWSWRNFNNAAGSFLIACNHEGSYWLYSGPGFDSGFSNGFSVAGVGFRKVTKGSNPDQIQNVDPDLFCFTMAWKKRLWFVEKDSTRAWYLPPDQITGNATQFDFGPQFRHGGHLALLVNWTVDGGEGMDDYLVAISSEGDVVVYRGYDPDSAGEDPNAFALHGIWYVGPLPAGRRQVNIYGGDVNILSARGLTPISRLVTPGGPEAKVDISASANVDPILKELIGDTPDSPNWYVDYLPNEDYGVIGTPEVLAQEGTKIFLRSNLGAWSLILDLPILCWVNHDHVTFAGSNTEKGTGGTVFLMFKDKTDHADIDGIGGATIRSRLVPAYTGGETPWGYNSVTMIKPTMLYSMTPSIAVKILSDYAIQAFVFTPTQSITDAAVWDLSLWDSGKWVGLFNPLTEWIDVDGEGYVFTAQMDMQSEGGTRIVGIAYWIEQGGPL
jgi:hypothetical protein